MLEEYGDFLTIPEICGILDVGKNTVYDLLKTRKIKNFRIGKRYRVTRDAVVDYILYSQQ
ncbi:MAG: helix-turn-helix domain-containing protein [Clostridium sp.]|nr:helix-turn-helix domain-containing protein [Clostridium sp.]